MTGLNYQIENSGDLIALLSREDIIEVLSEFSFDWTNYSACKSSELYKIFKSNGWTEQSGLISRIGRLVYSRLSIHLDNLLENDDTTYGNYSILEKIHSGKNSIVFKGEHNTLGFAIVLKFLRPGAAKDIAASFKKISKHIRDPDIVFPTDIIKVSVNDVLENKVLLDCLVFPYVEGESFPDFLRKESNHYSSHIAISFIEQIGTKLAALEELAAYHGDLHAENILVDQSSSTGITFKLIDLSFDSVGSQSLEISQNKDLDQFKQHIWRILSAQKSFLPHVSLRKLIGTEFYSKISLILSDKTDSFAKVMETFGSDGVHSNYKAKKQEFIRERFSIPQSFRLQRYEEFTDPSVASKLFVPFESLQQKINEFGNVFVSGNRGSGKSTYLASLAFFPSVDDPVVDFREIFGVYFPCRQGEFKALGRVLSGESGTKNSSLLHLIVIKVIRKTLETISEAIIGEKIIPPSSSVNLIAFVNRIIPEADFVPIQHSLVSEIDNIVSTVSRVELHCVRYLRLEVIDTTELLTAYDLIKYFEIIRSTYHELASSKFHILFDDAGEPHVRKQLQVIINELIHNSNPIYCVKLTAEKHTYSFESIGGKPLENGQDYFEQDITYSLFIGSRTGGGARREVMEAHFRDIVNQRLEHFGYQSGDIRKYLGESTGDGSVQRLTTYLAYGRKDAYYFGWTTVWNVADRIPRNLLELVSEIFAVGHVDTKSMPALVAIRDQDRAIKTISEKRLQSLSQISGVINIGNKGVSLGRKLFEVTITIGSTFRTYLRSERKGRFNKSKLQRVRQHLAIERNDMAQLHPDAEIVLDRLVTFGVLDNSRSAVARDDGVRKPYYVLNRIYCPAFAIGYQRDDHLKLSRRKLEQLLLDSNEFLKDGTQKLRNAEHGPWGEQPDLFVSQVGKLDDE